MSEPRITSLFGEWTDALTSAIALGVVTSIGAIIGWFRTAHKTLTDKIAIVNTEAITRHDELERSMNERMEDLDDQINAHLLDAGKQHNLRDLALERLRLCQENTSLRLTGIEQTTNDTNKLIRKLLKVSD